MPGISSGDGSGASGSQPSNLGEKRGDVLTSARDEIEVSG